MLSVPALSFKTPEYCPLSLLNLDIALCIGCFNLEKLTQSRLVAPASPDPLIISKSKEFRSKDFSARFLFSTSARKLSTLSPNNLGLLIDLSGFFIYLLLFFII